MIGSTFSRWIVIGEGTPYVWKGPDRTRSIHRLLCRCECGSERHVGARDLQFGRSQSCGCLNREISRARHTKHGGHKTVEYQVWKAMIARCTNQNNPRFSDYGGRGISVCDEWREFAAFDRDMGQRPSPRHSLDRKDNSQGYAKENCKWSIPHEQMTNRRCTRFVSIDGEEIPLASLAAKHGIPANTLRFRILKGWPIDRALGAPVRAKKPKG
jgi:hypothetical protein